MALLMTMPPRAEPVALTDAKAHLRLTLADDDAYITALISAARRTIESRYGLALICQSWALFCDHWPDDGIFHVPLWPLHSVDSLTIFAADDGAAVIDPAHYYLDSASRPARVALRAGRKLAPPGRCINGVRLSFTAGFGVDAGFVPQEVKQAVMATVADWYLNRGDEAGGNLPATAHEALAAYRNVRLA